MSSLEEPPIPINLYNPHLNQQRILDDPHRFKVIVCGRKFGKTTFAVNELLYEALTKSNQLLFYVGPVYAQAKSVAWPMMLSQLDRLPKELVRKVNESELYCLFSNGSRIEIKGADRPDRLRGVSPNGVVLDEYADMKVEVWDRVIRPALVDKIGWAIFIGTPKGYNHYYDLYNLKHPDYKSFHFTSYDNPTISRDEIEQERLLKSEDAFATEYLAEFRVFVGKIYKEFSKEVHVRDSFEPPMDWARYRAIDFGVGNPTAVLFLAIDNEFNIWLYDEIYIEGANTPTVAELIRNKSGPGRYIATFADRSGKAWILEYSSVHGIPMLPYSKESGDSNELEVVRGIDRVNSYLKVQPGTGKPKLFVTKNCFNTIKEFETYEWSDQKGTYRAPKKQNDHCMDALRYFIVSYQQKRRPDRQVVKAYTITGQPIYA